MSKLSLRVAGIFAALLAAVTPAVLLAPTASASLPQGLATNVTCYNGAAACTEYRYGFTPPGATGQFGIYYTVQWSASKASYKIIQTRWVNNSTKGVYWGDDGVNTLQTAYDALNQGSSSTMYVVPAGTSYTFQEAQFNGAAKGLWIPKGTSANYATSDENTTSWQYHTSGGTPFLGAFVLA